LLRSKSRPQATGDSIDRQAVGDLEHEPNAFVFGEVDAVPVHLKECQHDDESRPLVSIDERLVLGDAPEERRGLISEIRVGILSGMLIDR